MEKQGIIRHVFRSNFKQEEKFLLSMVKSDYFNSIALDTEYPGNIRNTPQFADEEQRYKDMKFNVENTKLIQVGFTVFNPETAAIAAVWQFNVSGFDPKTDNHCSEAVKMLRTSGVDFDANNAKGVTVKQIARVLKRVGEIKRVNWITFHGLYDLGYLLASVKGTLPDDIRGFSKSAGLLFNGEMFDGGVFDLKCMARERGWMGLEKLAKEMGVSRDEGRAHQAGSDSLLTAKTFVMALRCLIGRDVEEYRGRLFGIGQLVVSDHHRLQIINYCMFWSIDLKQVGCGDSDLGLYHHGLSI